MRNDKMTDLDKFELLYSLNKINYHTSSCYDSCGNLHFALWLDHGHLEFDDSGKLINIVTF